MGGSSLSTRLNPWQEAGGGLAEAELRGLCEEGSGQSLSAVTLSTAPRSA